VDLDVSKLGVIPFPSITPGTTLPFSSFESCVTQVQAVFNGRNFEVDCPNEDANILFLQYPFNVMTPSAKLDGLDGTIGKTCSGSVCSASAALVSCNVKLTKLNLEYEGFPYYFTPVISVDLSISPFSYFARSILPL
jgi:hypothetical protein